MAEPADSPDHPGVVVFPPLLFVACMVAAQVLHWFVPAATSVPWWARMVASALALTLAAVLGIGGKRALHGAGTNVRPNLPTTAVVSSGVYRFTRNPLYLALLLIYTALGLLTDSLWPFVFLLILLPVLNKGIVEREERYLARKFGQPYLDYAARVRRWI